MTLTIFTFAGINLGLFKINEEFFTLTTAPSFFNFIYYSFNNLFVNSIHEVIPAMPISQFTSMAESYFSLVLGAIIVSLLLSVKSQRYTSELNEVIKNIEAQGECMEGFIRDAYRFSSIEEAMAELEKLKAGFIKFINQITESIK